jgi:putative peptidoglycan lipid II flippase
MSIARSSMIMAVGTVLSRILGFVRAVLLAAMIGVTTNAADAFGVANQLPNNVYAIIVGGVLNAVLVPQIIRARGQADGGKGFIDRLLTLAIVVFGSVTVLATVGAPILIGLYTNGWSAPQLALATAFAYWCIPQLFFYGLYSMLGEVLNARAEFGPFMWAPVLNNVVSLIGMGIYIWMFGTDPTGARTVETWGISQIGWLAGSATAGVAAQALILFVSWRRIGLHFKFNFQWRGFGLRPAMKAATWTMAMVLVSQIGGLVQSVVASKAIVHRGEGVEIASIAAATIAWLIFMLPHSVATVSIATAYFTKISQHAHEGKIEQMKVDLGTAVRVIAMVSILATAIIAVLAMPISRVFVGEYPATVALAQVILGFIVGLLPFSLLFMLQRAFYALEDTHSPFWFTVLQISIYVLGAWLVDWFVPAAQVVVALALLTSISVTAQATTAYVLLRRKIGSLGEFALLPATVRFVVAAAAASGIGWLAMSATGGVSAGAFAVHSVLGAGASAVGVGALMLLAYLLVLRLLKSRETDAMFELVRGILRR